MQRTWNVTLYRDGKPVGERHGLSESDAVAQIYRLSRTTVPVEAIDEALAPGESGERGLAA